MKEITLKVGESTEIGGKTITVKGCGKHNAGGLHPVPTVTIEVDEQSTPTPSDSGKFDSLGLSTRITKLLNDAEGDQFASADALRDWINGGGDLSDAVDGLGDKSEAQVLEALGVTSE
jgi:DNA-directed RNA polymerase